MSIFRLSSSFGNFPARYALQNARAPLPSVSSSQVKRSHGFFSAASYTLQIPYTPQRSSPPMPCGDIRMFPSSDRQIVLTGSRCTVSRWAMRSIGASPVTRRKPPGLQTVFSPYIFRSCLKSSSCVGCRKSSSVFMPLPPPHFLCSPCKGLPAFHPCGNTCRSPRTRHNAHEGSLRRH